MLFNLSMSTLVPSGRTTPALAANSAASTPLAGTETPDLVFAQVLQGSMQCIHGGTTHRIAPSHLATKQPALPGSNDLSANVQVAPAGAFQPLDLSQIKLLSEQSTSEEAVSDPTGSQSRMVDAEPIAGLDSLRSSVVVPEVVGNAVPAAQIPELSIMGMAGQEPSEGAAAPAVIASQLEGSSAASVQDSVPSTPSLNQPAPAAQTADPSIVGMAGQKPSEGAAAPTVTASQPEGSSAASVQDPVSSIPSLNQSAPAAETQTGIPTRPQSSKIQGASLTLDTPVLSTGVSIPFPTNLDTTTGSSFTPCSQQVSNSIETAKDVSSVPSDTSGAPSQNSSQLIAQAGIKLALSAPILSGPLQWLTGISEAPEGPSKISSAEPSISLTAVVPTLVSSNSSQRWNDTAKIDSSRPVLTSSAIDKVVPGISADPSPDQASVTPNNMGGTQADSNPHSSGQQRNANLEGAATSTPISSSPELPIFAQALSTATTEYNPALASPLTAGGPTNLTAPTNVPASVAFVVHQSAGDPELSAGLQMWNGGDNAQTRLVQSAHLSEGVGKSEMTVALQSEALGAVELRAHVTGDRVGATIAVERHDAHQMIASDVSALHQALNDRHFRIDRLTLFQGSLHSATGANDGGSASQQREAVPQRLMHLNGPASVLTDSNDFAWNSETTDGKVIFDSNGRLSVQA